MENTNLTKESLENIIKSLNIPYNEGIQNDLYNNANPRLVFWDFVWEPLTASGTRYNMLVTYQISFFNYKTPRNSSELKTLIDNLSAYGVNPVINHEYVEKDKQWHSYFSIDVLENV